jgi:hypothetical protein
MSDDPEQIRKRAMKMMKHGALVGMCVGAIAMSSWVLITLAVWGAPKQYQVSLDWVIVTPLSWATVRIAQFAANGALTGFGLGLLTALVKLGRTPVPNRS